MVLVLSKAVNTVTDTKEMELEPRNRDVVVDPHGNRLKVFRCDGKRHVVTVIRSLSKSLVSTFFVLDTVWSEEMWPLTQWSPRSRMACRGQRRWHNHTCHCSSVVPHPTLHTFTSHYSIQTCLSHSSAGKLILPIPQKELRLMTDVEDLKAQQLLTTRTLGAGTCADHTRGRDPQWARACLACHMWESLDSVSSNTHTHTRMHACTHRGRTLLSGFKYRCFRQ